LISKGSEFNIINVENILKGAVVYLMRKKIFTYSFAFLFLLSGFSVFGQTVTIGNGSAGSTANFPVRRPYVYSTWEAIYLQSEIATAGTITSIAFNKANIDDGSNITNATVYMKLTAASSETGAAFSTSGYTTVYSGTITNPSTAAGWVTITLSTPFYYDNINNLQIAIDHGPQAVAATAPLWAYTIYGTTLNERCAGTAAPCDAVAMGATTGRCDIRLSFCGVTVTSNPSNSCVGAGSNTSFTVAASGATSYQWQVSTDGGVTWSNLSNGGNYSNVTTTTLNVTGVPGGFNGYQYRCACTNGCTAYSTGAVISVGSLPSAPTANAASGVGQFQFTANWSAVSGATGYYLDLATSSTFTFTTYVPGYSNLNVGNVTSKVITGLACGTTYYYQVRAINGCGTSASSNTITRATLGCSNNECTGAIALPVSGSCSSPWYSTAGATVSADITTCTSSDDVWFSFVAPATGTVTIDVMGSRMFDPQFDLLSGTCGAFTCLATLDNRTIGETESMYATGLTFGTTYYVKVNNYGGGVSYDGGYGAFAICITSGTTGGLVNDDASGAVALTNYDCYPHDTRGWKFYSTAGATNVGEPAIPACWTGTVANKTIWFKFTATASQQQVTTDWACSGTVRGAADNRMAIYSSSNNLSTGVFTLVGCLEDVHNPATTPGSYNYAFEHPAFSGGFSYNPNPDDYQTALTVTGLTIGNTYFIRIDAPDGVVSICTEPNSTMNDACSTALNAPLNTIMHVNTTGLGPYSANSANPTAIPDLGFSCGTTQNMMFYYFDCTASDLYYINQWQQLCGYVHGISVHCL
jgi:hypothetical protein